MRAAALALIAACVLPKPVAAQALPGLESFVDGVVASASQRIAGVQVAVVKDGQTLLVKGYGLAALAPERRVDPQRSLFRIASISKTFTWLALMQLEERGKLRLTDPVNQHLPPELAIPKDGWQQPVRILDLMNHTAGFEEVVQGEDHLDDARILSLQQDLARYRSKRVREPGTLSVYSNYGASLAGAIIAHVSGVDFETYIEEHVLHPLGMGHTTFREEYGPSAPHGLPAPMSKSLAADRAAGVEWVDGAWRAFPHHHVLPVVSAAAGSSTAADMARYMLALLDPTTLERAGVLRTTTFERMKQPSFRPAQGLRAIHHGFFDKPPGTHSALGYANLSHGGNIAHFVSYMLVFPELGLGVFAASNSSGGARLITSFHELILRHYFPALPQSAATQIPGDVREYAGDYRPLRRNYAELEAIFGLDMIFTIEAHGDSLIVPERRDDPVRYVRIAPDLFQMADGDARVAFLRDKSGRVARMVGADSSINADRVRFFETALWLRAWSLAGLVAAVALLFRRRRAAPARRVERWLRLTACLWLAFYVAAATWQVRHGFGGALEGYPQPILKLGLWLLMAAAGATALATLMLPLLWRAPGWSIARRAASSLALAVLLVTTFVFSQWNAVGLHYF